MAPPTPFSLDYIEALKKNVVCVRDRATGTSTMYQFNDDYQRFTQTPHALQLKESDLEPLYSSKCEAHSEIVFCKAKALGDQVFKVRYFANSGWAKVQCLCCVYQQELASVDDVLYINMSSDKQVDMVTNNRLNFQPVYSTWCKNTEKITVFGRCLGSLEPWNFVNDAFVKSDCKAECCQLDAPPAPFDSSTRGLHYSITHRDEANRPLMCLAVTWYNKEHGQMNVFMDQDGDIGEYEWNEVRKCFQLVKPLDTRCLAYKEDRLTEMKYDDGLRYMGSKYCTSLMGTIFFCWHLDDSTTQKYLFNPTTFQFILVKCLCCRFNEGGAPVIVTMKAYNSPTTGGTVLIWHDGNGVLEKMIVVSIGANIKMEKALIIDKSHLKPEEIIERRESQIRNTTSLTPMNVGFEAWVLREQHLASDGVTPISTVALMDGSVKPCRMDSYVIHEPDCVKEEDKPKPIHQNSDRYALDWDLTPLDRMICSYSNDVYLTCFNHFTSSKGIYSFDSTSGHMVHRDCVPSRPRTTLLGPSQVICGTVTPLSETAIILATNGEGRLMKIGRNPLTKEYGGMLPLRIISLKEAQNYRKTALSTPLKGANKPFAEYIPRCTDEEFKRQIKNLKSLLEIRNKEMMVQTVCMKNMESKLRVQEDQHKTLEKELKDKIQELEKELREKNLELQNEKKKNAEAQVRINIPVVQSTTHTEFDLTPSYRNYCLHTNHFYITAYNNKDQTTKHYVFNPSTCRLHQQDYCRRCPQDYTKGIKIGTFVSIHSAKSPLSKYPVLLMTDNEGRLVRIGFDKSYRGFTKWTPAPLQGPLAGIPNALSLENPEEQPIAYFGPYAQDFFPEGRYYCNHASDFLMFGHHKELQRVGHFSFNQINGFLYEHQPCQDCKARNPSYKISPSGAIMTLHSPYSKWPIMLTTNKDGSFNPIAFSPPSNRFVSMPKSIVVPLPWTYPVAVKAPIIHTRQDRNIALDHMIQTGSEILAEKVGSRAPRKMILVTEVQEDNPKEVAPKAIQVVAPQVIPKVQEVPTEAIAREQATQIGRQEIARQEAAHREVIRARELARQAALEEARQEAARQAAARAREQARQLAIQKTYLEAARQERVRLEAARQEEQARKIEEAHRAMVLNELACEKAMELAYQEAAREQARQLAVQKACLEAARQAEQARKIEEARQEAARIEVAREKVMEYARQEAARREMAREEQDRQLALEEAACEEFVCQLTTQIARQEAARQENTRKDLEEAVEAVQEVAPTVVTEIAQRTSIPEAEAADNTQEDSGVEVGSSTLETTLEVVQEVASEKVQEVTEIVPEAVTQVAPKRIKLQSRVVDVFSDEECFDEECSDEEEDCSDEEVSDEEDYDDEEEEEESDDDGPEVSNAAPGSTTIFQSLISGIGNAVKQVFTVTQSVEKKDEWCECSDEECSDEECSDEECSDEECSDEECSDEEDDCDCSDDDCDCDEEEEEEYSDEEEEDVEKKIDQVQRVCNFEPAPESDLQAHPSSDDTESVTTALEPDLDELSDTESVNTALEPSDESDLVHVESTGDISDSESVNTALEPEEDELIELDSTQDMSDTESVKTALEPDVDQDLDSDEPATPPYGNWAKLYERWVPVYRNRRAKKLPANSPFDSPLSEEDQKEEDEALAAGRNGQLHLAFRHKMRMRQHEYLLVEEARMAEEAAAEAKAKEPEPEPKLEPEPEVKDDSDDSDISHVDSFDIQDISDTESTSTALEPEEGDEISDTESVNTALEPEVDSVNDEKDLSDSVHTALEPDLEDNMSIISTTSTAKEFSIVHDSSSEMGSDISYLDSDLGSSYDGDREEHDGAPDERVELLREQEETEVAEEGVVAPIPPPVPANPCNIM